MTSATVKASNQLQSEDLQRIKWFAWVCIGIAAPAWAGWITLVTVSTTDRVTRNEERIASQYALLTQSVDALREDIAEIKQQLREVRK